jgi:hypothetical protein
VPLEPSCAPSGLSLADGHPVVWSVFWSAPKGCGRSREMRLFEYREAGWRCASLLGSQPHLRSRMLRLQSRSLQSSVVEAPSSPGSADPGLFLSITGHVLVPCYWSWSRRRCYCTARARRWASAP